MIYNMVSSKSVVAKIIADLDLKEQDFKIADIREYIGEAMEKIGSIAQLDHRIAVIPYSNYQAKLPCDLYRLNSVAFSLGGDNWIPMTKSTNTFSVFKQTKCCSECNDCCDCSSNQKDMLITTDKMLPIVKNLYNLTDDKEALNIINDNPVAQKTISALINNYTFENQFNSNRLTYDVKPGFIYTSIPEGVLKVSYHAIHTDDEGMPVIPDNPSYFEAIYWYVAMKLYYVKYLKGQLPQHVYYDMKRSWNFYRKQAYAESLMPNTDELETISNTWNKLYPEINEHDTFYEYVGDKQRIYNQNRI